MTINTPLIPSIVFDSANHRYLCFGQWSILNLTHVLSEFKKTTCPINQQLNLDGKNLSAFDSAGALVLLTCIETLTSHHNHITLVQFTPQQRDLLALVKQKREAIQYTPALPKKQPFLTRLGQETVNKANQVAGFTGLIGNISIKLWTAAHQWRRFQVPSIVANIFSTGITALPILGLLSFLIGVVLAYQMGLQLETYGANNFIAFISGLAIFREFAPLITAIIVAGRTSSSFTAQIGSMKINEEIDALYTMGLSPVELLVVPKMLGLLLIFPLLIFWSDIFGTLGAMLMSKARLHVGYADFLTRLRESVGIKQLMLGLYKAPTFAILISLVGCYQGFAVEAKADSVGEKTTKSVVQALFLIIIADAVYSIIYSWMDL